MSRKKTNLAIPKEWKLSLPHPRETLVTKSTALHGILLNNQKQDLELDSHSTAKKKKNCYDRKIWTAKSTPTTSK